MPEIPLSRGLVSVVDQRDYERIVALGPWHAYPSYGTFYGRHSLSPNRQITLHSFITGWPMTDHINGDGLDNRRVNLRPATPAQNRQNATRHRRGRSGFIGVVARPNGRFYARIAPRTGHVHLGAFPTAEDAARAYDRAAAEMYGEFAVLNFPTQAA